MPLINKPSSAGTELGYAQTTTTVVSTVSTEGTAVTLVSLSSIVVPNAPIILEGFMAAYNNGNNLSEQITIIMRDDTSSTVIGQVWRDTNASSNAVLRGPGLMSYRFTPSAGTRSYSLRAYCSSGSSITYQGGNGGSGGYAPMFLRAIQV